MIHSAYQLNKQGDSIHTWRTPFPVLNIVPCLVLMVAYWLVHGFLRRQVRWFDTPISLRILWFVVIHTVKSLGVVNEAEVDVFLEFSCFFYNPADVGSLISGFSAFSKFSLYIWKFSVHVLLKPRYTIKEIEKKLVFWSELFTVYSQQFHV